MSTRFCADVPFEGCIGYLQKIKNRRYVHLVCSVTKKRRIISFARYVYSVVLEKEPPSDLMVDHIDNDKTNDCLHNLQLLSSLENIKKSARPVTSVHGSLARYRHCRCEKCKRGKSLHNAGKVEEYRKFIAEVA